MPSTDGTHRSSCPNGNYSYDAAPHRYLDHPNYRYNCTYRTGHDYGGSYGGLTNLSFGTPHSSSGTSDGATCCDGFGRG